MIRLASVMLIIVFCFCPSLAQVKFDHLSIREGISNNSVRDIKQDETGFLWFATLNGVTRFDGNGFRYFLYDSENPVSISSNRILQIYPDKKGQIWLISYDRKVNLYNRESNTFSQLPFTVQRPVYHKEFNFVFESSPGVIWFVDSSFALQRCRINPNKNTEPAEFVNDSYQPLASVNCIRSDSCGALWIGTTNGLIYFPSDTIDFASDQIKHLLRGKHISVTDIADNDDELLIGADSQGVMSLNKADFIISKFSINQTISYSHIWNIRKNNRGQCLITTVHDGFVFYDQVTNYSKHFGERETRWPLSDYLTTYIDHYGHFWLVSKKNGVVRIDCGNGEILPFRLEAQLRASVVDEERLVIKEDSNLDLWIGTYGSGLFRFIKEQKRFEHYVHQKNNPASLSSNFILSLYEDRSKNLWIGTRNGGLNKLSLAKTKFQQITPFENPIFDHQNEVRAMVTDSNGNVWVGTKTGEILVYDAQFRLLANLNKMAPLKGKIPTIGIYVLFFDHEGKLWVGTKGEGIFLIEGLTGKSGFDDLSKMQITRIHRGTHSELSSDFVYSIIEDPKEQIWVGTYMGGLYRFRKKEPGYQADRFVSQSGDSVSLPDNKIRQLNIDSKGNLWISTTNGLALIPQTELDRSKPSIIRVNNRTESGIP
jgi:ligand-binding sensor domain-containing protein